MRVAGPGTPDRDVQKDKKRMIENPRTRQTGAALGQITGIVHKPVDVVRIPFNGKNVKIIGESALRESVSAADSVCAGLTRAVQSPMDNRRLPANVFHDIHLTTTRPANRGNIGP